MIHLPDDYLMSDTEYPVLYLLDAHERSWAATVKAFQDIRSDTVVPAMILIGVVNPEGKRNRDMLPVSVESRKGSGGADLFLDFMGQELLPFVDGQYRSTSDRTIAGFSNSGLLVVHCLTAAPDLFTHFIASSPMLGYAPELILGQTSNVLISGKLKGKSLFIIYGGRDSYSKALDTTPAFDALVSEKRPAGFRYQLVFLEQEGHIPQGSLERGLMWTFSAP